jgi:hypothetical protein
MSEKPFLDFQSSALPTELSCQPDERSKDFWRKLHRHESSDVYYARFTLDGKNITAACCFIER